MPKLNPQIDLSIPLVPDGVPAYRIVRGEGPLVVSVPHSGMHLPEDVARRLTPEGLERADTDWHLEEVYDFVRGLGATLIVATHSRYVVDLNRPPDNGNLYPGQDTTGLVPLNTFAREPLYRCDPPDENEWMRRRAVYWRPYHDALRAELERLRARHTRVVLWDAHSIASRVPRFFSGRLPSLNLGTANGTSCAPGLVEAVLGPIRAQDSMDWVVDGRFQGGYITRAYGRPSSGVHALQMEMIWALYMAEEAAPFLLDRHRLGRLEPVLRQCLEAARDWAHQADRMKGAAPAAETGTAPVSQARIGA